MDLQNVMLAFSDSLWYGWGPYRQFGEVVE